MTFSPYPIPPNGAGSYNPNGTSPDTSTDTSTDTGTGTDFTAILGNLLKGGLGFLTGNSGKNALGIAEGLNAALLQKKSEDYAKNALGSVQGSYDERAPLRQAGLAGMLHPEVAPIQSLVNGGGSNPFTKQYGMPMPGSGPSMVGAVTGQPPASPGPTPTPLPQGGLPSILAALTGGAHPTPPAGPSAQPLAPRPPMLGGAASPSVLPLQART